MMEYNDLVIRDTFQKFMKRSYQYLEDRYEPEYKTEVTFIGKAVMLEK